MNAIISEYTVKVSLISALFDRISVLCLQRINHKVITMDVMLFNLFTVNKIYPSEQTPLSTQVAAHKPLPYFV